MNNFLISALYTPVGAKSFSETQLMGSQKKVIWAVILKGLKLSLSLVLVDFRYSICSNGWFSFSVAPKTASFAAVFCIKIRIWFYLKIFFGN
jgi:hypothetical protein